MLADIYQTKQLSIVGHFVLKKFIEVNGRLPGGLPLGSPLGSTDKWTIADANTDGATVGAPRAQPISCPTSQVLLLKVLREL